MGFFSSLKDTAIAANEEAHGVRLHMEFRDSVARMGNMPSDRSDQIIARFVTKRSKIVGDMWNWTNDGKLEMAQVLKKQARGITDFNVIDGYALWMTSAWLESGVRKSEKAKAVFTQLDELAKAHSILKIEKTSSANDGGDKVLFDSIAMILEHAWIDRLDAAHPRERATEMSALSKKEQLTLAASIGGVATCVAKEFHQEVEAMLGLAIRLLELYGMDQDVAGEGISLGIEHYSPEPTTQYGTAMWRGVEGMRGYRAGKYTELDCCELMLCWHLDRKW